MADEREKEHHEEAGVAAGDDPGERQPRELQDQPNRAQRQQHHRDHQQEAHEELHAGSVVLESILQKAEPAPEITADARATPEAVEAERQDREHRCLEPEPEQLAGAAVVRERGRECVGGRRSGRRAFAE
jgi:hypothetical protein